MSTFGTPSERFQEREERWDRLDAQSERREFFATLSQNEVEQSNAIGILEQMGYYRKDRLFCSLNLTDEQFAVMAEAQMRNPGNPIEEVITEALRQ